MKRDIGKLFKNTIALYILQFSNILFPFLTIPYQTRVLGSEYYGKLVFALAFAAYFQIFIDFGFSLSATKEVSLYRDNKKEISKILSAVITSKFIIAIIGFILMLIIVNSFSVFSDSILLFILCYITPLISAFFPDFIFRGIEQMKTITIQNVISKAFFTILIFVFVKKPDDFLLIPILIGLGNFVAVTFTWVYMIKKVKIKPIRPNSNSILHQYKSSFPFFASRVATTLYSTSNVFVLGLILPSSEVAYYSSADKIVGTTKAGLLPISDSLFPYMVKKRDYKLIFKILIFTLPLVVIGIILVFNMSEDIVKFVFGQEFTESAIPLKILILSILVVFPSYLLGYPLLGAMGYPNKVNNTVIVASLFHFIGLAILLFAGKISIINVALLTLFTEILVFFQRASLVIVLFRNGSVSLKGDQP